MDKHPPSPPRKSSAPAATDASPDSDLATLHAELTREQAHRRRLATEFDLFRQRTARDAEQNAAAQKESFIRELLPVVDNLERALDGPPSHSSAQLRRGVELTLNQLLHLLADHGIEPEESLGQPFDARRQEAINARFDPRQPDHTVLEVVQRGYRSGDRVIRPAKVIINDVGLTPNSKHGG